MCLGLLGLPQHPLLAFSSTCSSGRRWLSHLVLGSSRAFSHASSRSMPSSSSSMFLALSRVLFPCNYRLVPEVVFLPPDSSPESLNPFYCLVWQFYIWVLFAARLFGPSLDTLVGLLSPLSFSACGFWPVWICFIVSFLGQSLPCGNFRPYFSITAITRRERTWSCLFLDYCMLPGHTPESHHGFHRLCIVGLSVPWRCVLVSCHVYDSVLCCYCDCFNFCLETWYQNVAFLSVSPEL